MTGTVEPDTDAVDAELLHEEGTLDLDERAEPLLGSDPVTFYGTDFDVNGLVRRFDSGDIVVPGFDPPPDSDLELTGFQRRFVWSKFQMDRFIESLLLGYPVPGVFLVQHPDRRMLILDGQQRLRTLHYYFKSEYPDGQPFALANARPELAGYNYGTLPPPSRRALDNTFIHATVIRYEATPGGRKAVYDLFERLNSGGTKLYPQEIRVALYNGDLVNLLRDLNKIESWRSLYGPVSGRLKDQELILRFTAFYYNYLNYSRPLKGFLNDFLDEHRNLEGLDPLDITTAFKTSCDVIDASIGRKAFRTSNQVNAAQVDAVMHGISFRLQNGPIHDLTLLNAKFEELAADQAFLSSVARATADEDRVGRRLRMARDAFADVG